MPANTWTTRPPVELPQTTMLRRPRALHETGEIARVIFNGVAAAWIPRPSRRGPACRVAIT